jgi:hypothetical protein
LLQVFDDGTVCLMIKAVADTYNIRRIMIYHSASNSFHGGEACNMKTSKQKRTKLKDTSENMCSSAINIKCMESLEIIYFYVNRLVDLFEQLGKHSDQGIEPFDEMKQSIRNSLLDKLK